MIKKYISLAFIVLIVFGFCFQIYAAEILQVKSSSILLIGDNNRTYTVKMNCLDVPQEKEKIASDWLRSELPRHTRVNLKPSGSEDGMLLAKVIAIGSDSSINDKMKDKNFAENNC